MNKGRMMYREDDWAVSTLIHPDAGGSIEENELLEILGWLWETAISRPEHGRISRFQNTYNFLPVERYKDAETAETGHKKWIDLMKENSHRRLPDV